MSVIDRFRLDGKRAFVSGGSRGFGGVLALAIAEAGADIVLAARGAEGLANVAAEVRDRGRGVRTYAADVADPAQCVALCGYTLSSAQGVPAPSRFANRWPERPNTAI